jgi:hypothetical protein
MGLFIRIKEVMIMAISSYGVELKWGATEDAVEKVISIKDFPDLIGEPNLLETTSLSDSQQTYINGIKSADLMTFTFNYTKEDFQKCKADEGKAMFYELAFSDGSTFTWQGQHTVGLPGKGVDEVLEATLNIAPSSPVAFDVGA